ncbi:MAG: HD domain-containing protein [Clostridia bacterium]
MIDINKSKKEFMNYVKQYGDVNSGRISLKVRHILRVVENSKFIAKELKLDDNKVALAELIGLFHDIGRFEQVRIYDTFSDKDTGLDHAAYSLKVLYEDNLISKFIDTDQYDDIIKKAVFNHNKAEIDKSVKGEALLFSKMIRDADKLDIYKAINQEAMKDIFWYKEFDNIYMSDKLLEKFKKNELIDYKDIKNNADQIYAFFGYIFDFNFPSSYKIIKESKYLEKFYDRIKDTFKSEDIISKTKELLEICNKYMDKELLKI